MRRSFQWTLILGVLLALTLGVAACGGDDDDVRQRRAEHRLGHARRGQEGRQADGPSGPTTSTTSTPGITYYQMGFQVIAATQKALYGYEPEDAVNAVPDLAEADPEISEDGKTVTVKIKTGRQVLAAGRPRGHLEGRQVRDRARLLQHGQQRLRGRLLRRPRGREGRRQAGHEDLRHRDAGRHRRSSSTSRKGTGGVVAGALALPLSAPVPEEYAEKFDKENPSAYGQNQVATGPYMIENDASGKAIGYQAGRRIHLVRNPNWDESTRLPARVPRRDRHAAGQRRHHGGVAQDPRRREHDQRRLLAASPRSSSRSLTRQKDQLELVPNGGGRWVAMNTTIKPFDDLDVRQAVVAGFDREAMRLTRGGELIGDIPTHYIPPEVPGFEEAGGLEGPGSTSCRSPRATRRCRPSTSRRRASPPASTRAPRSC